MRNNYNYYPNNYNRMDYDEFINNLNFPQNMMQNNQTQQSNNTLYGPYEGYIKGNLFKNLYEEYKDYQPAKLLPKSEEEEALLNLNQRYTMPDNRGKALLTDIGTEELAHIEMISTMIYQLTKDATLEELKEAGLDTNYAEHNRSLYPTDSNGVPFTVTYFAATGDPLADLSEDMAAEQKARAVYENLIDLTNDPDVIGPLLWLRQREVVHFNRFKELYDFYKEKGY